MTRSVLDIFEDPQVQSYYPETQRKRRLRIWADHVWWMLRHWEVNHFYYFHGCDRQDAAPLAEYAGKKEFVRLRDKLNAKGHVGGRIVNYNCLLQDKFLFSQYVKSLGFPTPEVYGLADRNSVYRTDTREKTSWEKFIDQNEGSWFVKDIIGQRGECVVRLEVQSGQIRLGGKAASIEELKLRIGEKNILQEPIVQHAGLARMNPGCVNTMRLVTARAGEEIVALAAMLRLGAGANACDNLASGGIAVGVHLETGQLSTRGVYKPGFGKWALRHPDTGFEFAGARLPFFEEAVTMARRLHHFFYGTHSVGWDIAFGQEGPIFLEGNNSWEIPTLQVFDGELIRKFMKTIQSGKR